ncbi:hypothetical protein EA472_06655 [Natrarchaeobius oligotrophus]|uniref:Uncharacterized protein n=2 Tax=Natrarchaeobius TaxID=2501796 RepID=A0A3N6MDF2_NATCH|nr:hypothetical protein EA472_06655 [Natrarchaeobius chitinivorans]
MVNTDSHWVIVGGVLGALSLPYLLLYAIGNGELLSLLVLAALLVALALLYRIHDTLSRIEAELVED